MTTAPAAAPAAPAAPAPGADNAAPPSGTTRPAAATADQGGHQPIENQSIATDSPARLPGRNALNPPAENLGGTARKPPDWLHAADKFWDGQNGTVKLRELSEAYKNATQRLSMRTDDLQKAMDADRRSRVPPKPADYKVELTKEYLGRMEQAGWKGDPTKLVDPGDPMVRMLAAVAHRQGLDQEQFGDMLNHYHYTKMATRPDPRAEAAKLGENSQERAGAVQQFLLSNLGAEDTKYLVSAAGGPTARFIQIMERLMETAGGRSFMPPGAGSTPSGGPMPTKADLQQIMMSDAYNNPRHPDYAATQQRVRDGWARLGGGRQIQTSQSNPGRVRAA